MFSVSTTHRLYSASVTLETDGDSCAGQHQHHDQHTWVIAASACNCVKVKQLKIGPRWRTERVILPGGLVGDLALVPELSPIHVHAKVNARRGESRPQK